MNEPSTREHTFLKIIRDRVEHALRVSPEERLLAGLKHSDLSMQVVEDGIRHQHPEADDGQIQGLLAERINLMRRMENPREHL